jgi:hypothetical protein
VKVTGDPVEPDDGPVTDTASGRGEMATVALALPVLGGLAESEPCTVMVWLPFAL